MSGLLNGKVAFVTGGARGLGRAIIDRFAAEGANGIAFDTESLEQELPSGWFGMCGDVTAESDLQHALARCAEQYGRLDVVVANAGVVPPWRETETLDLDEWDRVFAVNVRGVVATIKHAVPFMKTSGGSIVAMGSLNSHRGHESQCAYTASKHAVLGIVRAVAQDLGRYGIRVNALGPGPIATEALVERVEGRAREGHPDAATVMKTFAAQTPLGRMAMAEDVAGAALYLASDLSAGTTGHLVPVDAGLA